MAIHLDIHRREGLLDALTEIVDAASEKVMEVYETDFEVARKSDLSPVTLADEVAEELILAELARLTPGVEVIAEERFERQRGGGGGLGDGARGVTGDAASGVARGAQGGGPFWLVDPLDGTKEFVARREDFTVNVGLIEDGRPVLGVVAAPAREELYAGAIGLGSFARRAGERRQISCRRAPGDGFVLARSRWHCDEGLLTEMLGDMQLSSSIELGSSLKLCLLAAGDVDLYIRPGRTMEWDTAAGHAIVAAAGGRVCALGRDDAASLELALAGGGELAYGKPGHENPSFVAFGLR